MPVKTKKTIAITANSYHYLLKFRSELARYLHQAGFEVIFVSPLDESALARDSGIEHCPVSFDKGGYSFIALAVSFVQMVRIIRTRKVDIVINNTIKPLLTFSFVKYVPFLNVKVCSIVTGPGLLVYA